MLRTMFEFRLGSHPYLASALMVGAVTGAGFFGVQVLHAPNLDVVYLLVVLVSALNSGRGPALFTAVVSAVIFDYCFDCGITQCFRAQQRRGPCPFARA